MRRAFMIALMTFWRCAAGWAAGARKAGVVGVGDDASRGRKTVIECGVVRVPGARAWRAGGGQERGARGGAVQGVAFTRSTGGAGQFRLDEMRSVAEIPATIHQGFNTTPYGVCHPRRSSHRTMLSRENILG